MTELDFQIEGKDIGAATFKDAVAQSVGLLQEFDSVISAKPRGSLRWYVSNLHSENGRNLSISFYPKLKKPRKPRERIADISSAVTNSFLSGFDDIENRCEFPAYLSEYGLRRAGDLASLIGKNGATGFRFATDNRSVEVTERASENIGKLLPIKRKAIGSVEGKLEAINLHNHPRFVVYNAITSKAVTCEFNPERSEEPIVERVKELLGRRVVVYGTLYKNVNGDTLRVAMERLLTAEEAHRVTLEEECLAEPEFASAFSTAEYIRRIRGG